MMTNAATSIADHFSLTGKVAVVTGAANGIGRGIADLFVAAGATVVAGDVDVAGAKKFAAEAGGASMGVALDQSDRTSVRDVFAAVKRDFGRLDVVVNCAAIYPFMPFEQVTPEFLNRILGVNLNGVFYCCQEAVMAMKAGGRGGAIINISSIAALQACIYDNVHYSASKAAVDAITVSLALEYAADDIRVNAVMPGSIASDHAKAAQADYPLRGPLMSPDRLPLRGAAATGQGETIDVAAACLYLASAAGRYVTGQILGVDGGFRVS